MYKQGHTLRRKTDVSRAMALLSVVMLAGPWVLEAQSLAHRLWMVPKAEHAGAMQSALAEYSAWLRTAGEPWRWSAFRVEAGDNVGNWLLRSGGHQWADFDERDAGFGPLAMAKFMEVIAPLLESYSLQIETSDGALSRRPEQSAPSTIFYITEWHLAPGGTPAFNEAVAQIMDAHDQTGKPFYGRYYRVTAAEGTVVRSSVNLPNWEALQGVPEFGSVLSQVYGEEEARAIWQSYNGAVIHVRDFVLRIYPALGVPGR